MGAQKHGLLEWSPKVKHSCIIEIGEGKGDGSSEFLEVMCDRWGIPFFSVDVRTKPQSNIRMANFYSMTGEEFLTDVFPKKDLLVAGAYLDNFDWCWNPQHMETLPVDDWQSVQSREYVSRGVYLNNVNSSLTHLRQTMLLEPFMVEKGLILFDDTWFNANDETFGGKGGAAIYHLLEKGWHLDEPYAHHLIFNNWRNDVRQIPNQNFVLLEKQKCQK